MPFINKTMDYQSKRWQKKRAKILRRDKYICQLSKRYGKIRQANTVHHIFPVEYFPEYQWEEWNMISICNEEHNALHDRETHKLTKKGMELLMRTARAQGIAPPGGVGGAAPVGYRCEGAFYTRRTNSK